MQNASQILAAYMRGKLERSESLPLRHGRVNLKGVAQEASIPYYVLVESSELREQVAQAHLAKNKHTQRLIRQQQAVPDYLPSPVLYRDLLSATEEIFEHHTLSKTSWSSYLSALKTFMKGLHRSPEDSASKDFTQDFEHHLAAHLKVRGGATEQARKIVTSRLHFWRSAVQKLLLDTALPDVFSDALRALMARQQINSTQLSAATEINVKRLYSWTQGERLPSDPNEVHTLERALEVAPGVLSSRVGTYAHPYSHTLRELPREWWPLKWQGNSPREKKFRSRVHKQLPRTGLTNSEEERHTALVNAIQSVEQGMDMLPSRRHSGKSIKSPYFLPFADFSPKLKSEWDELCAYKCEEINLTNRLREGRWNSATSGMVRRKLESFLGFLNLPTDDPDPNHRGKGMVVEDLTLGFLVSNSLLQPYCEFLRMRNREKRYTRTVTAFINNVASFLRPESGWLWQNDKLLKGLPEAEQKRVHALGGWQTCCDQTRTRLLEDFAILHKADPIFDRPSCNPFTPIMPLLERNDPLTPVLEAIELHREHIEGYRRLGAPISTLQACKMRIHLILSLLVRFPLRRKHWSLMEWGSETSHLYRDSQRGWRLAIPYAEFKNSSNRDIFGDDPDGKVVIWFEENPSFKMLIPDLELYLDKYRPLLMSGPGALFPRWSKTPGPWNEADVGRAINTWSENYLAEGPQSHLNVKGVHKFGPHAFRDLVATHILKATGSFEMAAYALLDSVEMVRNHYTRFTPEDRLKQVFDITSGIYVKSVKGKKNV